MKRYELTEEQAIIAIAKGRMSYFIALQGTESVELDKALFSLTRDDLTAQFRVWVDPGGELVFAN